MVERSMLAISSLAAESSFCVLNGIIGLNVNPDCTSIVLYGTEFPKTGLSSAKPGWWH